jgi:hypothetical protein
MPILSKEKTPNSKIEWFKINRPELYEHVLLMNTENHKCKILSAPVKSGKRGAVEISALINPSKKHIFITALMRKADKNQFTELESFGIMVNTINNSGNKDICISNIDNHLKTQKIIIHLDELDYGCGERQLVSYIWSKYKNNDDVEFIIYSATPQVAMVEFLVETGDDIKHKTYKFIPPQSYYGIKRYIDDGKFQEASNFIKTDDDDDENDGDCNIKFTSQGKKLIKDLTDATENQNDPRHISVLRLAGTMKIRNKKVQKFTYMKENQKYIEDTYKIRLKFGGSDDNNIEWDNKPFWDDLSATRPFIIVINQTSGRSTEWSCHDKLVWFHTARTEFTPNSTRHQDQERPAHYICKYKTPVDMTIYGDLLCAQYSSEKISLEDYKANTQRKIDARIKRGKATYIEAELDPQDYANWDDIPSADRRGKRLSTYICDDNQLRQNMKNGSNDVKICDTQWNKWKKFEGFYMTNVRSSRSKFKNGNNNARPIWYREDIESDKKEGINIKSRVRINVIYKKDATDYKDYKFTVRRFVSAIPTIDDNTSMYNT